MKRFDRRQVGVWLLLVACLFLILSPSLMAQTAATGALAGTITDQSGAVVPNVTVTVTSVDTGQARTVTTDADGTYKVSLLPPGSYGVKFQATGFNPVEVPSVTVNVTETNVLDRHLEVGSSIPGSHGTRGSGNDSDIKCNGGNGHGR